jgi:hypothetical protein
LHDPAIRCATRLSSFMLEAAAKGPGRRTIGPEKAALLARAARLRR